MADSLLFNGSSDYIVFDAGDIVWNGSAWTSAFVCKVMGGAGTYRQLLSLDSTYDGHTLRNTNVAFWNSEAAASNSTFTVTDSDGWVLLVYTNPGTTDPGDHHKYVYSTTTWTHEAGDGSVVSESGVTTLRIGYEPTTPGNYWYGNILLAAFWEAELNQTQVEALATPSLQAFIDAAPDELWRFDTLSTISATIGTGAETSRSGTSLDTGDVPTGWVDLQVGRTYKRLYGPAQLTDSAADLYTCPASTITRTLHIHASNPSGSTVDANLSIGTDAAGTRVWDDLAIPADGIVDVFDPYELAAGEKIQGWAATAGTVVVTITGYEDPV